MELIEIFKTLVKIPSPSLYEQDVASKIVEMLSVAGVETRYDDYGNVYAKIPGNPDKPAILLSSHMDVVGDDSPINIAENENFIETDKKRTLGADDKAGASAIVALFLELSKNKNPDLPTLEAVFTRDEENSMTGIEHVEFKRLNADYVLVLDSDKLGNLEIAGAGYIKLTVSVKTPIGGHSGLDIGDAKRLNAAKLVAEIVSKIPQGVYKLDDTAENVVTSINLGSIVAGGIENAVYQAVKQDVKGEKALEFISKNSMSNIINKTAYAHYSLRSSDTRAKDELISEIKGIIDDFNSRYGEIHENGFDCQALAVANLEIEEHLPIFEKSDDNFLVKTAKTAANRANINLKISSFHAGAETHVYANRKNAAGKVFKPVLLGIADIYNMHSADEKIDIESYKKGYEFLKEFIKTI